MGGGAENAMAGKATQRKITLEELSKHRTPEDAWVTYRGKVYDVSNWEDHPGTLRADRLGSGACAGRVCCRWGVYFPPLRH